MEQKHVVHMSSVHPWDDVRIYHKEAQTVLEMGWLLTLIARFSAANNEAPPTYVRILPEFPSRLVRVLFGPILLFFMALKAKADVYHFHDPELIPLGLILRALGKNVIYDVHENVPADILTKGYLPHGFRKGLSVAAVAAEWLAGTCLTRIVCVNQEIAERFPPSKTVIIENAPILEEGRSRCTDHANGKLKLIYTGICSQERGIDIMLDAIVGLECELTIAGSFRDEEFRKRLSEHAGWRQVTYLGQIPRSAVLEEMATADAGLILFRPGLNHSGSRPNKLFEYMAAELPIIASDFGEWRKLYGDWGACFFVDPENIQQVRDAIAYLIAHRELGRERGKCGLRAVQQTYNWSLEKKKLVRCYLGIFPP
ncbi:glycosyltransferase [Tepidicaulis sp.]|uniref:glycosyltransferase n=1 Tax=Tepidicaulis sp. TaxID=1920809 RepID=UPI003B5B74EB